MVNGLSGAKLMVSSVLFPLFAVFRVQKGLSDSFFFVAKPVDDA